MKTFFSFGIAGLILLTSTGLYAQSEDRLEAGGYRLEGAERTLSDNIVANCDNSGPDLNCHLMMNPAMVEESEEAIEQFILGKTQLARKYSVKPSETCDRESTD
ncbi:MAG TPA: hypothetical protein VJK54_02675, partial [Chthoniobacterales bacterium]|nr:hypothetical protein [Chthoniobacterales bacterium]